MLHRITLYGCCGGDFVSLFLQRGPNFWLLTVPIHSFRNKDMKEVLPL